ncbi:MAG: FMN-binding protein [Rikenellaceae bacterium]
MWQRVKYIVNIVIVALLFAAVAIQRDGRIAGDDVAILLQEQQHNSEEERPIEITLADGTRIINSTSLAKDVIGFGGRTPIKIFIKNDIIQRVEVEPNSETPSFLDEIIRNGFLERWNGLSLGEAATQNIDVVSGATYSSVAISENVKRAAQWGANIQADHRGPFSEINIKDIAGLLVILLGVCITLSSSKNRFLLTIQLILNVVILGFWCGSFLSLSTITAWIGNGVNLSLGLVSFALLCSVIIVPLIGKKGSYCHLHCPMGSAQELIGRIPLTKIRIKPNIVKFLNKIRYYTLSILLFMMWLGVGFDLMNYEIFSAFILSSASTTVLIMASIFLILSLFIHRPYCRFICPTGALITMAQMTK